MEKLVFLIAKLAIRSMVTRRKRGNAAGFVTRMYGDARHLEEMMNSFDSLRIFRQDLPGPGKTGLPKDFRHCRAPEP